jgi:hypothetical protein
LDDRPANPWLMLIAAVLLCIVIWTLGITWLLRLAGMLW